MYFTGRLEFYFFSMTVNADMDLDVVGGEVDSV